MGLSGIGFTELLMLFVVVILVFGTKKLATFGSDLGTAIRGFRNAMSEGEQPAANQTTPHASPTNLSSAHNSPQNGANVETAQPAARV